MRNVVRLGLSALALASAAFASGAMAQQQKAGDADRWGQSGKERINEWTIGLAAGLPEGAPLRFAAEMARVLDDGNNMRVMPIVTRGIFENFGDLLQLRGVDAAIVYGDTLVHFDKVEKVPRVLERVNYVASLFPSELQIFVRPEINSIQDLAGKPVNFNTKGTAAAYSGPLIFSRLGIKVIEKFDPHPAAMREIRNSGEKYVATVWVTSKPVQGIATQDWPAGFKLLSVPYTKELEELYLPASLETADYPKLIPAGQKIQTIAVPAVLAVYNWGEGSARYRRMQRFVDYLFQRLPKLQQAPNHPAWKSVNLAAPVPGWRRYPAVQAKLQQLGQAPAAAATTRR